MAIEIERKFLVEGDGWRAGAPASRIEQGYLSNSPDVSVRVRIRDQAASLTVKGERSGLTRDEFEYPIPLDEARAMLALCVLPPIIKTRHDVLFAGRLWEVDEFAGRHTGLTRHRLPDVHSGPAVPASPFGNGRCILCLMVEGERMRVALRGMFCR